MRAGEPVDLGYFGGNGDALFGESPAALKDIQTFSTMRITGVALYVVGLGLLVTDVVLLAQPSQAVVEKDASGRATSLKPLAVGLLVSGTGAGLTGAFLMQGANAYLSDAVDHYNADLARRLEGQLSSRAPRGVFLRYGSSF